MKLVIMTKSTFFVEEDKILTILFEEGLDNLHISKTDHSPHYAERLLSLIPSNYHRFITVHQNFNLTKEFSLAGIHLDADTTIPPKDFRGRISSTCSDILKLKDTRKRFAYVTLKNINDGIEYPMERKSLFIPELKELQRQGLIGRHVYAMGGIKLSDIPSLKEYGFGGVVVCGALWQKFNIQHATDFRSIIAYFKKLKQAVE